MADFLHLVFKKNNSGFRSLVLNYTYVHCFCNLINSIWFINIILSIMHFFKDIRVLLFCRCVYE